MLRSLVRINGELSEYFECFVGVSQAESLSPFLFCLFTNYLEKELPSNGTDSLNIDDFKMFILLYADDCAISQNRKVYYGLDLLHDYCARWRLTVNTEKTKVLIFVKEDSLLQMIIFLWRYTTRKCK